MNGATVGALSNKRILVAEDEYFIVTEIVAALEVAGAVVIGPASTASEACNLVAEGGGHLDAALLDVNLGGTMIWPVIDLLTARGTPMVLSTGYENGAISPAYAHLPHYEKPVVVRVLLEALAKSIRAIS